MGCDGRRKLHILVGASVLSLAASTLFAQDSGGGESPSAAERARTELITAEFRQASIREVLDWIANRVGKTIVVEAGIEDKISVNFRDLHYVQAVEVVADLARCVTRQVGDRIVVEKPPRVTMEFKGADPGEVIRLLAKQAGWNVVIAPDVKGEVTMRFTDVPSMRALQAVVKTLGYTLVEEDGGKVIRVVDRSKLKPFLLDVTSVTTSNEDLIQLCTGWAHRDGGGITTGGVRDPGGSAANWASRPYPFMVGSASSGPPAVPTSVALLDDHDMAVTLRLLAQDADTWFVMRPNVCNQQRGTRISIGMFVGEEIHYSDSNLGLSGSGTLSCATPIQETSPPPGVLQVHMDEGRGDDSSAGSDLSIIPHLVVGTNRFIVTVIPPDDRLTMNASQSEGDEESRTPSAKGLTMKWVCRRPGTVMTHLLVESGETVVLAWPHPEGACPTPPRFPYVREDSVLGQMFMRLAEKAAKSRDFIFVCPRIVRDPSSPR